MKDNINCAVQDSNETKGRLTELDNLNAILKVKDEKVKAISLIS